MRRVNVDIIAVACAAIALGSCGRPAVTGPSPAAPDAALYHNDFENADEGRVPADLFVIDGQFAVKSIEGNKYLELAGEPLNDFAVLFGPGVRDGVEVTARVRGEASGRRVPAFGVGLGGVRGFKVQFAGGRRRVELVHGRETVATAPYAWASGDWTRLRLRVTAPSPGRWLIQGKAWPRGSAEPAAWSVTHTTDARPSTGRAAAWGTPYSGKPIRFDDLAVRAVPSAG